MARKHAYRIKQGNPDEVIELIAGTSMPTGRVFRKARENEDLSFKETIQIRDSLTGAFITYVFSYVV